MEPFLGSKGAKNAFWAQKITIWAKNAHFGPKVLFWRQKTNFGRKVCFFAKSALWRMHELTYPQPKSTPGATGPKKSAFLLQRAVLGCTSQFLAQSALLAPKKLFEPNVHFSAPIPRMLIKPIVSWWNPTPFGPKSDFGPKSAFLR